MNAPAIRISKPVREQVSREEWETRVNLAACYRLMADFGMVEMIANPTDIALREKIMLGSMQAGLAFSNAILGAVHAMSHSLGGFLDLPHGLCNAVLVEHVVAFNYSSAPERFKVIAEVLGIDCRGLDCRIRKRDHRQALAGSNWLDIGDRGLRSGHRGALAVSDVGHQRHD